MNREIKVNPFIILYNRLRILNPFRKSIPLKTNKDAYQPFLIIGSGRSGTTLLRSMLNQSKNVEIPPESFVLPLIYKRHQVYKKLPWKDYIRIILGEFTCHPHFKYWGFDITATYNELSETPPSEQSLFKITDTLYSNYSKSKGKESAIWGDKTPLNTYHLPQIDKILNQPKYINLIRDGRDVVASYLKANLADSIEDACSRWKDAIESALNFERANATRLINIRYEALVESPEKELRKVCEFLQIEFNQNMLNNSKNTESLGDSVYAHHKNLQKPVDTSSIGKWKENLSEPEVDEVNSIIGNQLRQLGYIE